MFVAGKLILPDSNHLPFVYHKNPQISYSKKFYILALTILYKV